jgi:hypothetical protein
VGMEMEVKVNPLLGYPSNDIECPFSSPSKGMLSKIARVEKEKRISGHFVDFYLPQHSVAFEFQGGQHYRQIHTGSIAV